MQLTGRPNSNSTFTGSLGSPARLCSLRGAGVLPICASRGQLQQDLHFHPLVNHITVFGFKSRRWHGYCPVVPPVDRHGNKMTCPRQDYQRHWNDTGGSFTSFQPEWMSLSQQRMFKYTLSTDGLGCSPRFQKVLATGQVGARGYMEKTHGC